MLHDAVVEDDRPATPDGALAGGVGKFFSQRVVFEELGFDIFQMRGGLVMGVGDDEDVGVVGEEGLVEDEGGGDEGGFGAAAGSEEIEVEGRPEKIRISKSEIRNKFEVRSSKRGYAVEVGGQPEVHSGGREGEVVREEVAGPG